MNRGMLIALCVVLAASKLEVPIPADAKPGASLTIKHGAETLQVRIPDDAKPGGKLYVDSPAAPTTSNTRTLNVTVPEEAEEGHTLYIDYKGRKLQVLVPKGKKPGQSFQAVVHLGSEPTEIKVENGILILNRGNFNAALNAYSFIAVDFYAPWCGHCKSLAPEWEKTAEILKEKNAELPQPVVLAKFDASSPENEPIADAFGVEGYPAIKYFRRGQPFDYKGPRTAAAMAAELQNQADVALVLVDAAHALESLQKRRVLVVLGFFDPENSTLLDPFAHAAEVLRGNTAFGLVPNPENASTLGLPLQEFATTPEDMFPSVVMLRYYDRQIMPYNLPSAKASTNATSELTAESLDVAALSKWLEGSRLPDILHLTTEAEHQQAHDTNVAAAVAAAREEGQGDAELKRTAQLADVSDPWITDAFMRDLGDPKGVVLRMKLVAVLKNATELEPVKPVLTRMAAENEGEVACGYFVASEYDDLRKHFNVQESELPALVAVSVPGGDKYAVPFSKMRLRNEEEGVTMSFDAIDQFVADIAADFIKPTIKSQELSVLGDRAANRQRDVVRVTGKSFTEDVMEAPAEVLLQLYGPDSQCARCEKVDAAFKEAATFFSQDERIWFAKMDLTANEMPKNLQKMVSKLPTLIWFGGDSHANVSKYRGKMDRVRSLVEFVGAQTMLNKTATGYEGPAIKFDAASYRRFLAREGAVVTRVSRAWDAVTWYVAEMAQLWEADDVLLEASGLEVRTRAAAVAYVAVLGGLLVCLFVYTQPKPEAGMQPTVSAAELVRIKEEMMKVYSKHNPDNVSKVDEILKTWAGKEDRVLAALHDKYRHRPAAEGSGEGEEAEAEEEGQGDVDAYGGEEGREEVAHEDATPAGESTAECPEIQTETKKDR